MILPYLFFTAGLLCAGVTLLVLDDLSSLVAWAAASVTLIVTGWLLLLIQFASRYSRHSSRPAVYRGGEPVTGDAPSSPGAGTPGSIHPPTPGVSVPSHRGGAAGPLFETWPYRIGEPL